MPLTFSYAAAIKHHFTSMVEHHAYPCVGAKAAVAAQSLEIQIYEKPDAAAASRLIDDLGHFERRRGVQHDAIYASFVAVFTDWPPQNESVFQDGLFAFLQLVHDEDFRRGAPWDPLASPDPSNNHFGFSINSRAYFLVGLHSTSSRQARRFQAPALVFNSHFQFAQLRRTGLFEKLKLQIRERDRALQGSYNPEMVGSKEVSEARQYSGRRNEENWSCPLNIQYSDGKANP